MAVLLLTIAGKKSGSLGPGPIKSFFLASGLALLAVATTACAPSTQYMGIDLATPPTSVEQSEIRALAQRAQYGDKQAQLELGIRFEEGNGVRRDLETAKKLYTAAASDSGGRIWVYSPSVGNGTKGRVIPVDRGPKRLGSDEATYRFSRLEKKEEFQLDFDGPCKDDLISCFVNILEYGATTSQLETYRAIADAENNLKSPQINISELPCTNAMQIYGELIKGEQIRCSKTFLYRVTSNQSINAHPKIQEILLISDNIRRYSPAKAISSTDLTGAIKAPQGDIFDVNKLSYKVEDYIVIINFLNLNDRMSDIKILYLGTR